MTNAVPLAVYFLAAFGLAYIVGHSVISAPIRSFIGGPIDKPRAFLGLIIALLECPACFGTWTGLVVGGIMPRLFLATEWWLGAAIGACATAGVNFLLGARLMPSEPDPVRAQLLAMFQASQQLLANQPVGRMMTDAEVTEAKKQQELFDMFEGADGTSGTPDEDAPDDTPENWAKYRDAQDLVDKLAARNSSDHNMSREQQNAIDRELKEARLKAGALRPKDPMMTTSLGDAPLEDELIPEDIAAMNLLKTKTTVIEDEEF